MKPRKSEPEEIAVYGGQQHLGDAIKRGNVWLAVAPDGKRLGKFTTSKQAVALLIKHKEA